MSFRGIQIEEVIYCTPPVLTGWPAAFGECPQGLTVLSSKGYHEAGVQLVHTLLGPNGVQPVHDRAECHLEVMNEFRCLQRGSGSGEDLEAHVPTSMQCQGVLPETCRV